MDSEPNKDIQDLLQHNVVLDKKIDELFTQREISKELEKRRDSHIDDIRKSVAEIQKSQVSLLNVIAGNDLDKDGSIIQLVKDLKKEVKELNEFKVNTINEFKVVRKWERGIGAVLLIVVGAVVKFFIDGIGK